MQCKHEQFECNASVTRLTDDTDSEKITGYTTDITVKCIQCGIPFEWIGIPGGYSPSQPMVNFDGTVLRAPIKPSSDPVEQVKSILK